MSEEIHRMKHLKQSLLAASISLAVISQPVVAHDPVFGIGPHVLFKDGVEAALNVAQKKAGEKRQSDLELELTYGITGDWAAGIKLPYAMREAGPNRSQGQSDIQAFTKYRFWREDSLGLQESMAVMLAVNAANGDAQKQPPLGNGATDIMTGLTYGYESIKWYRWASLRYALPGENAAGLQLGNQWRIDFVGGWRAKPPEYTEPDTVWLLELNGEISDRATLGGVEQANSGGTEWFISPGIFWTTRNFAIKSGIQIPLIKQLNGTQAASDYRFKATFEWHL